MPYNRPWVKSLQPSLISLYLTCKVRYLPFKYKFLQKNNFSYRKNKIPIGNLKFPIGIQELPIEKNNMPESNFYRKYHSHIGNIIPVRFLENPIGLSTMYISCWRIISPRGIIIFLREINF